MKSPHAFSGQLFRAGRLVLVAAFACAMLSSPFQVLLYVSFFLFLAGFLMNPRGTRIVAGKWDIALGVFLLAGLVNVGLASYPISALEGCGVFLIYGLVYFYIKSVVLDGKRLRTIVTAVAISLLAVCGFALVHYFLIRRTIVIGNLVLDPALEAAPGKPILSILQHPMLGGNMIAVLATFLLTSLLFYFRKIPLGRKIFLSSALAVALVTMAMTYSRGAFLFVGIAGIVLAVITKRFKILAVLFAVALVFVLLPNEKLHQTLKDPLGSPNIQGRILQYKASLEIFSRSNWATGIGFLNFRHYYLNGYASNPDFERFPKGEITTNRVQTLGPLRERIIDNMPIPYVHDFYLSLLVENGVIGFLAFFIFLGSVFAISLKNYLRYRDLPSLQALVLIPGFLANSLFDNLLYTVPAGILIWVLLGLSQNRSLLNGHEEKHKEGLVL